MNRPVTLIVLALTLIAITGASRAQTTSDQASTSAAPAATGLDTSTQLSENPPLSSLDEPSFEPGFGTRSYLAPKAEVSQAVDSNGLNSLSSGTGVSETTRALGAVKLQKLWKIHPLDIDYIGGVDWYDRLNGKFYQIHSLAATQRILWRTGQLALRDSFSYLPEGTFGFSSFGGGGGFSSLGGLGGGGGTGGGIAGGGGGGLFSSGQLGSIGNQPRITNMAIVDVTQYLSPRTSVVASGGYGITDFLNNPEGFINSQETTTQLGYNYQFSRRDQIGVVYGFQEFHYPASSAGSLNLHLWQLLYGHRVSGRLNLLLGGGPEWVHTHQEIEAIGIPALMLVIPLNKPCAATLPQGVFCIPVNHSFISSSARVSLTYHVSSRTNVRFNYMRYVHPGSGFFAGANSNIVTFGMNHSLGRHWSVVTTEGYTRSSRLLSAATAVSNNARSYQYWFAGAAIRRQLGHQFGAFVSYQFNDFGFGSGYCSGSGVGCRGAYQRHIGLIGLDWTPRPIRLD